MNNFKLVNNLINNNLNKSTNSINNESSRYLHHSCIYKSGKPIYTGINHGRNVFNGRCICFSTHAEMDVIIKLLKGDARTAIQGYNRFI